MKTKPIVALMILIILQGKLMAQDAAKIKITYDLKTGLLDYEKEKMQDPLKWPNKNREKTRVKFNLVGDGGNVVIQLKNINPFLYKIKISELQNIRMDATQVGDGNDMSFFNVITYDVENLIYNATGIILTNPDPGDPRVDTLKAQMQEKTRLINAKQAEVQGKINILNINSNQLNSNDLALQKARVKLLEMTVETDKSALQINLNNLETERKTLEDGKIILEKVKVDLENERLFLENERASMETQMEKQVKQNGSNRDKVELYNRKVDQLIGNIKSINKIALLYRSLLNMLYADGNIDNSNIKRLKENLLKKSFPSVSIDESINLTIFLNEMINDASTSYSEVSDYYSGIISSSSVGGNTALNSQFRESFSGIKAMMAQVKVSDLQKFVDHIDRTYNSLNQKMMNSTYYANVINDDADFIKFTIEGTPVAGLPASVNVRPFNVEVEIPIRGGVKIDLSTGLLNTFMLFNKSYRYEPVTGTPNTYNVVENDQESLLSPNFGVMLHVYRRNSLENFRMATSIGIGLSEDQNARYYAGFSGIMGRKQRFIISLGAVAGQVNFADQSLLGKQLSLSSDDLLKPIPFQTPAPYRIGAFLGFTFNLSGSNSSFSGKMDKRGKE